eukprot:5110676-Pleurochrysis_carterae.AAC.2
MLLSINPALHKPLLQRSSSRSRGKGSGGEGRETGGGEDSWGGLERVNHREGGGDGGPHVACASSHTPPSTLLPASSVSASSVSAQ